MINLADLRVDPASLGQKMILTEIRPIYAYADGKRTSTQTGFKYFVALPQHHFEKLGVRVDGKKQLEMPEDAALVVFDGLEVSVFAIDGHVQISAKAKSIKLVQDQGKS